MRNATTTNGSGTTAGTQDTAAGIERQSRAARLSQVNRAGRSKLDRINRIRTLAGDGGGHQIVSTGNQCASRSAEPAVRAIDRSTKNISRAHIRVVCTIEKSLVFQKPGRGTAKRDRIRTTRATTGNKIARPQRIEGYRAANRQAGVTTAAQNGSHRSGIVGKGWSSGTKGQAATERLRDTWRTA